MNANTNFVQIYDFTTNLKYLGSNITWKPPKNNDHNIRHQIHNDIF
jgi:hypothetical protein